MSEVCPVYGNFKDKFPRDQSAASILEEAGPCSIAKGGQVKRQLKERQISMIAIGGTIGTGLFLGIGIPLSTGGPLGLFLGYAIMGTIVISVQFALGEMVTQMPCSGALTTFSTHFVDPALGFAVGWCYWYSLVTAMASELIAAAIVVDYWKTPLSKAIWISLFFLTASSLNFLGVRWYGESEYFFASLKVVAIVTLLITGIVLDCGGGPTHEFIGIKYLKEPGLFRHTNGIPGVLGKLISLWSVLVQTSYSFLGSESVALAAAEAQNPRTTIPNATKSLTYRILLFYISSALMVGLLVPSDEPRLLGGTGDASSSPFVIAINRAKIKLFPDLINAFVLLSAYSAASATLYGASRIIYGLVKDNMAPKFVGKVTSGGVPIIATIISVLPGFLAYMNLSQKASELFSRLVNISSMTGLFTWWTICLAYIRYHKALKLHKISRDNFAYKAPFQPYLSYYGLVCLTFIMLTNGVTVFGSTSWSWRDFAGAYITCPFFFGTYFFWKIFRKTKTINLRAINLHSLQKELQNRDMNE